eukprot:14392560-Alexandrium_andersonii.AAC.1
MGDQEFEPELWGAVAHHEASNRSGLREGILHEKHESGIGKATKPVESGPMRHLRCRQLRQGLSASAKHFAPHWKQQALDDCSWS